MLRRAFLLQFTVLIGVALKPALAAETGDDIKARLFAALKNATTEKEARQIEHEIWQYWLDLAPEPEIRAMVDQGMRHRSSYDFEAAEKVLDEAVESAPSYAEARNQRAFVRFLREDNSGALADLENTLKLEPKHFGALSGMYHVLMRMGRTRAAVSTLARAVEIHPWIQERHLLPPDPDAVRPAVKGKQQDL
ncbi:tetratricopeptide repeat protein [Hoeflea sp.]|uniref:tetratricopeptide repeat protein n=1 Tax=Hoeflea sp. TaxID=1940281 RepID=UPI003B521F72